MMKKEKDIAYGSYRCAASDRGCGGNLHVPDGYNAEKKVKQAQEEESKDVTSKDAEAQDTGELAKNPQKIRSDSVANHESG